MLTIFCYKFFKGLLDVSIEILWEIFDYLPRAALFLLAQSCEQICHVIVNRYRHVWEYSDSENVEVQEYMQQQFRNYLLTHLKFDKKSIQWLDRVRGYSIVSPSQPRYSENEMRRAISSYAFVTNEEFEAHFDREEELDTFFKFIMKKQGKEKF